MNPAPGRTAERPRISILIWHYRGSGAAVDGCSQFALAGRRFQVCPHETKGVDAVFPDDDLKAMAWPHIRMAGMKGYNGVPILS